MAHHVPHTEESDKTVLKITTVRETERSVRVKLCGQFTGEYVSELDKTLSAEGADASKVALDLSNVTFVDREAMEFLCAAKSRDAVTIENIPSYVLRWIEQEGRCRLRSALQYIFGRRYSHRESPEK